jgi:hypothetical protein
MDLKERIGKRLSLRPFIGPQRRLTRSFSSTGFCADCTKIFASLEDLVKAVPESVLPNGFTALDISQGCLDTGVSRRDAYPSFTSLRNSVSKGCRFCSLTLSTIESDKRRRDDLWSYTLQNRRSIQIDYRFNCTAELGAQTFGDGEWMNMLSSLQICLHKTGKSKRLPIVLDLYLYGHNGRHRISSLFVTLYNH